MARCLTSVIAVLFLGLFQAQSVLAIESASWGAVKAQVSSLAEPNAKLVVTANAVAGQREELIFRGKTDWRDYPQPHPSNMLIETFHVYHPFAGDVVIGLGLNLPAGKYRAFTFRYRTAGRTITGRSLPVPSTLDAYGYLYVMFEWRGVGSDVEQVLVFIERPLDPGYLEIYGIR